MLSAFARILRSRRLAVWLIVVATAYVALATLLPNGPVADPETRAWLDRHPAVAGAVVSLGLTEPFRHPAFVALVIALSLSTAACAWERQARAWQAWCSRGAITPAIRQRLASTSVETRGVPVDAEDVSRQLRECGMSVRSGPNAVYAEQNVVGLMASPVFHWALVVLFAAAGLGQLVRAEGFVNVPIGESRVDTVAEYLPGSTVGPLFGRATGFGISATDFDPALVVDGVERGPSPFVKVHDDKGVLLAEGWVYPNHPVRATPLTLHSKEAGPVLLGAVRDDAGEVRPVTLFFALDPASPMGIEPELLTVESSGGAERLVLRLEPRPGQRVGVRVVRPATEAQALGEVGIGETVELPQGYEFTIEALTAYAQLTVVNDPTTPFIYASFALAVVAFALRLVAPPRFVRAVVSADGGLRIDVQSALGDSAFGERVLERLAHAQGRAQSDS